MAAVAATVVATVAATVAAVAATVPAAGDCGSCGGKEARSKIRLEESWVQVPHWIQDALWEILDLASLPPVFDCEFALFAMFGRHVFCDPS